MWIFGNIGAHSQEQTIFAFGGDINLKFVKYVADLTGKENPKVCYVPTASADNEDNIRLWNYYCSTLNIEPRVLRVWFSSSDMTKTFEEILLDMDAIVVGGGNTLNMLAIWKAQEIDEALRKALKKGIILAGGSAGSLCWFQNGISDSRPVNLSIVDGLTFLPFSNCPHYDDNNKRDLYHKSIFNKTINAGYACEDKAGILFKNGKFVEAVSLDDSNNAFFVSLENGAINSQKLNTKILLSEDALSETEYATTEINQKVRDFSDILSQETPLNAFVSFQYLLANGKQSAIKVLSANYLQESMQDASDSKPDDKRREVLLNDYIYKVLVYNESIAGIINKYSDFYSLWYFVYEDNKWLNAGEDFGGETIQQAEILFREKAKIFADKIKKLP
jgi:peptidase E